MSRLRHILADSVAALLLHSFWLWVWGGIAALAGGIWAQVREDRPVLLGSAIGLSFCLLMLTLSGLLRLRLSWKQKHPNLTFRRWLELRRYTDAGLSWIVINHRKTDDGKAEATLRVSPTGIGRELPRPLTLIATCAGSIETIVDARHYPSDTNDLDTYPTDGPLASVKLHSPRLYPPGYLDIQLRATGPDNVRVLDVKRNPR